MRATAVVFDSLGTLFDLEPLRARITAIGLPPRELEGWLARTFRDGIALSATGTYRPFREVAASALLTLVAEMGHRADPAKAEEVLAGLVELPAVKDMKPALVQLSDSGSRLAILTNASVEIAEKLLGRADTLGRIERVVSVDEVAKWKPFPEPFQLVARHLGVEPSKIAFVSADPWEVQGARAVGLFGVLLQRRGGHHQPAMPPPDLTVASLAELAQIGLHFDPNG